MFSSTIAFLISLVLQFPGFSAVAGLIGIVHVCLPPVMDGVGLVLDLVLGKKRGDEEMTTLRNSFTYNAILYILTLLSGKKP